VLAGFHSQLLHVLLHKLHLGIQVIVSLMSIFELFFKLKVAHFELINGLFVASFSFFQALVVKRKLVQFVLELSEFRLELVHGLLVHTFVVIHL